MKHLDLFSGIGGFAYAADQVWDNVEHIFCDNNKFCQKVLNEHWEGSKIYGDIREIIDERADIVTGGFPCQPFSQAGKRKGTADDRYLWPEMLRVIQLAKPEWVIAENVRGLVTWNEGMVLEQVCSDLEAQGYEIQPLIIPALAVNAPHRRDRVWFIAHNKHNGRNKTQKPRENSGSQQKEQTRQELLVNESKRDNSLRTQKLGRNYSNTRRSQPRGEDKPKRPPTDNTRYSWSDPWFEVAARLCGVGDGLPDRVDRVKALGNSIVPQIAVTIFESIRLTNPEKGKSNE